MSSGGPVFPLHTAAPRSHFSTEDIPMKMKQSIAVLMVSGAIAAAPVLAQTPAKPPAPPPAGGAGAKTAPSAPKPTQAASPDAAFAKEAAIGGMAEVELGNLAKEKASSSDVKQFADRMVTDHSRANDDLKQWAQQKNVTLPTEVDAKHRATRDRLAKLSGDAFDKAYMRDMLADHRQDVAAFQRESKMGKDADLKAWAGKTLPTLQEHLKQAQQTAAKVNAPGKGATKGRGGY
jgi:putative membrane protein